MKTTLLIVRIISRIIAFPFWAITGLIAFLFQWIRYMIYFVKYGGEALCYMKKDEPESFAKEIEKLTSPNTGDKK